MKTLYLFSIVAFLLFNAGIISSCTTTKMPHTEFDKIKNLSPSENKALVYIVRPSAIGFVVPFKVTCDDMPIGSTNGMRFIYVFVDSGTHKFGCKAENKSILNLRTEAGKIYFIEQKVLLGLVMARTELVSVTEASGRKKLKVCKLSGDCPAHSLAKK